MNDYFWLLSIVKSLASSPEFVAPDDAILKVNSSKEDVLLEFLLPWWFQRQLLKATLFVLIQLLGIFSVRKFVNHNTFVL